MSMTLVNAKIYVARVIGGGSESQESIDMAAEAILRAYQDWQGKKYWRFLLKDTSASTAVSATATKSSAVVNAPSTGAFDFVNVGQTVTYSGAAGTLTASTTVSTVTRGSDGVVTSITLSNALGGGSYTTETGTFTFSANIPITIGSNDYSLPNDFNAPFNARLLTTPRTLTWRDERVWDRLNPDTTLRGTPLEYTTFNPYSALTQNYGTVHIKFDRVPDATDTLALKYYRRFSTTGTNIDVPDEYLYQFLDYARNILLATKKAQDDPASFSQQAQAGAENAAENDDEPTDDNDVDQCMKSQYEMGGQRPLWGNGDFDPFR